MLILQGVGYQHPNGDLLFSGLDLTLQKHDKIALIGHNGVGKSILLQIMAGKLPPLNGTVKTGSMPYYVPQLYGQFNDYSIAQALHIDQQLGALKEILEGKVTDTNLNLLNDDWNIEERCREALKHWQLDGLDLHQSMSTLSGGQKTKVFLAGITIHEPELVLLDEPSNHLDTESREILYDYILTARHSLVVVSHDRTLLNLVDQVKELSSRGLDAYGGNYDFYLEQKAIANKALNRDLEGKEKALRKAREVERETLERQQKLDARGRKKQEKAGLPAIVMNSLRNKAERSTSKIKNVHAEKTDAIAQELGQLRASLPETGKMKVNLDHSGLHKGKVLAVAVDLNFSFDGRSLWKQGLNFRISSGERIAVKGPNGSGKTTLVNLILGRLVPTSGTLERALTKAIYIDQDYSLIDNTMSVYQQAREFNSGLLAEHDIKMRLNRFLFTKEDWDKPCSALSGGEKMRLMLCALTIGNQAPDLIILDEPTNNLDIQNVEILTAAVNEYQGTLLIISHDAYFLEEIRIEREIILE